MFRMFSNQVDLAKPAQAICNKKGTYVGLNIYLLGIPKDENILDSIVPNAHWFIHPNGHTYLDSIEINGYRFNSWTVCNAAHKNILSQIEPHQQNRTIVLTYITNQNEITKYPTDAKVLHLFMTKDEHLGESVANTILWKSDDNLNSFYERVMEKIEEIANPQLIKKENSRSDNQCRLV